MLIISREVEGCVLQEEHPKDGDVSNGPGTGGELLCTAAINPPASLPAYSRWSAFRLRMRLTAAATSKIRGRA